MSADGAEGPRSIFPPLLLLALSLLAMAGFQAYQLVLQQNNLQALRANQEPAVAESQRIRAQLQSITQGTADLAAAGNENAQRIIDELARQGITVTGSGSPAP
jgi:hypothetical protein